MDDIHLEVGASVAIHKKELASMLTNLRQMGYQTIGPRLQDNSIVYGPIDGLEDLPHGYTSEQKAGFYRLINTDHTNYFNATPGAPSWKQYFFPPITEMFSLERKDKEWQIRQPTKDISAFALIGVRPCELAAILNQDRIFLHEYWQDLIYRARRERAFLLTVNCLHPCGTCFCTSMGTGPDAKQGFDLCMTELTDVFVVKIGSETGRMLMEKINCLPTSGFWLQSVQVGIETAKKNMGRSVLDPEDLPDLLLRSLETERWSQVAKRCLSCTNCTLVCPTCFCWEVRDVNNLTCQVATRERVWDSCFNPDYSYIVSGNTRPTARSRYRQWLIHKFASWKHQFGLLGCVGCGRCITWCPAGIDITEEIAAIRQEGNQ